MGFVRGLQCLSCFIKRKECDFHEASSDMPRSKLNYGKVESGKEMILNNILLVLNSILVDDGNYL